jgi:hypothetical protein
MAIRAHHFALRYLSEDALPTTVPEPLADVEPLVSQVIEFEDHRVGLTAVHAGIQGKVVEQVFHPFLRQPLLLRASLSDAGAATQIPRAAWSRHSGST